MHVRTHRGIFHAHALVEFGERAQSAVVFVNGSHDVPAAFCRAEKHRIKRVRAVKRKNNVVAHGQAFNGFARFVHYGRGFDSARVTASACVRAQVFKCVFVGFNYAIGLDHGGGGVVQINHDRINSQYI